MVSSSTFAAALSCLALLAGTTNAAAVNSFKFSGTSTAPVKCPQSDRTVYTAPNGNRFGILCDTDTNDTSYQWEPCFGLSFRECLCKCDDRPGCNVVTYTGTCYLKKSAFGQSFTQGATDLDWTAAKIGSDYAG